MKIGLIDMDGHNFPNLALMKLSAHHKSIGDAVEWVSIGSYDKTYISKIFSYTKSDLDYLANLGKIVWGGTGSNKTVLPDKIEHMMPDYSIYQTDKAYGFLTRGCPNKCSWCVVPDKEGGIKPNADIEDFWTDQKEAILLDNNVLASDHGIKQIEKITKLGIKIDFNQGLDAKRIDKPIAKLLSKAKWVRFLRLACDTKAQIPHIKKALKNLNTYGVKNYRVFVYVLVKNVPDALERVKFLRDMGCDPFAQPYRDFTSNKPPGNEAKNFARWVNRKALFKAVKWEDYNQRRRET